MARSKGIVIEDDFKGYPVDSFCIANSLKHDIDHVLIPGGLVDDRIERLACDIANDYSREPFSVLCVLKGGHQFFNSLLTKIRQYYRYSSFAAAANGKAKIADEDECNHHIHEEFIRIKSYEDDASSGKVQILGIENLDSLRGKNVLIVEDIIDTGKTMSQLMQTLQDYELKCCRVAALFLKRNPVNEFIPDYVGFEIPDKFIIGCSLDYNEYFRGLNHVCVISEHAKRKYSTKTHKMNGVH
ncbi:hypoxanthine-guanine phosphoribosyltransferase-like protein [Dinothrombium tinctorium]|uniref:Hypoxanthine phosphoribosyltransferase n=1 Tax=Dinothrombium tinctorium TaxID=1965070 RepID=A0A443RE29_9ACAR|nr:hypoxanthine-guanine phosphoribosyltransferase-like protein [Dinothrombium tinctorium]